MTASAIGQPAEIADAWQSFRQNVLQDAALDAFIKAYRKLSDLREFKAFPGWFMQIALKHGPRLTREKRLETVPLDEAVGVESPQYSPDQEVEKIEGM